MGRVKEIENGLLIRIAECKAGELPRTWHQCSEQDKWEVAFAAGLLAAMEEVRMTSGRSDDSNKRGEG